MRKLALPQPLIMGMLPMGRGMSLFTVRSFTWRPDNWFPDGTIITAKATVKLKE